MLTCTFFGHRDCPEIVFERLTDTLRELILIHNVTRFLLGCNGNFDAMVYRALKNLYTRYPIFSYSVVLPSLPKENTVLPFSPDELLLPDNFESFPPQFAVDRRNEYMLKNADFVVTYVTRPFGGAAKFAKKAMRQGKTVIQLE